MIYFLMSINVLTMLYLDLIAQYLLMDRQDREKHIQCLEKILNYRNKIIILISQKKEKVK